jgi:hypothetical protein
MVLIPLARIAARSLHAALRIGIPRRRRTMILRDREYADPLDDLEPVMSAHEVVELQRAVATCSVDDALVNT